MKHNLYQGRLILSQGWASKALIADLLRRIPPDHPDDLCEILLKSGKIDANQASLVRSRTDQVLGPRTTEESGLDIGATGIHSLLNTQAVKRTGDFIQLANEQRPPTERLTDSDLLDQAVQKVKKQAKDSLPLDETLRAPKKKPKTRRLNNSLFGSAEGESAPLELLPLEDKLKSGQDFNDYNLIGELSRGAMGVVFKAHHHPSDRTVALKFMLDNVQDETEQLRFQREAQALIQLKHPNIVEIFDYGRAGNRQYLAMQLIAGKDLHSIVHASLRLQNAPPDWEEMLPCLLNIAEALQYCHERSVIHRDVKPSNIILEEKSGHATLVDFGLIKMESLTGDSGESDEHARLTKTQEIVGTPQFMSPEQFSPHGSFGSIGPKTDVWSFAATMFFVLTGENAFSGRTMIEIFDAVANKRPRKLRELNPDIPEWMDDLCDECFTKNVSGRPNIDHVVSSLKRGLRKPAPVEESPLDKPMMLLYGLTALTVVIFLGLLLANLTGTTEATFVSVECPETLTQEKSIEVTGRTNSPEVPIRVTNKIEGSVVSTLQLKSGPQGSFRQKVLLDQGVNTIIVSIDLEDQPEHVRQFLVPHDSIPPSLELNNRQLGGKYLLEDDYLLHGRVFDTGGVVQFLMDGQPIRRNSDGSFAIRVDYRSRPKKLRLTSFDVAKNTSDSTIVVVTQRDYKRFYKKN